MTSQVHRTMLIADPYREAALDLIAAAAGEEQRGMLSVAICSEDDEEDAVTEHMSTGNILSTFADLLPLDEWDGEQYVRVQEPDYDGITDLTGATQEQIQPILAAAIVTAEPWKTTLANLNLVIKPDAATEAE